MSDELCPVHKVPMKPRPPIFRTKRVNALQKAYLVCRSCDFERRVKTQRALAARKRVERALGGQR